MALFFKPSPKTILVPQKTLGAEAHPADLLLAVVTFYNRMRDEAAYLGEDLPAEAHLLYSSDYYVAQVNNGGHRQFAHNSNMDPWTVDKAIEGLRLAGMQELSACLAKLKAAKDAGSEPDFEALDRTFFSKNAEYYDTMHRWIRPKVKALPVEAYKSKMEALLKKTGKRLGRYEIKKAVSWQNALCDRRRAGFDLAASCGGNVLLVKKIWSGNFFTFVGMQSIAWNLELHTGTRVLGINIPGFTILIDKLPARDIQELADITGIMASPFKVEDDLVEAAVKHAEETLTGIIALGLFEKAKINIDDVEIFAHVNMDLEDKLEATRMFAIRLKDERMFILYIGNKRAVLVDHKSQKPVARIDGVLSDQAQRIIDKRTKG